MDKDISVDKRLKAQKIDTENDIAKAEALSSLKSELYSAGLYDQQERKKKEEELRLILENALFLKEDEERRQKWIESIPYLSFSLLNSLISACIRENLRFKQHKRNLILELNKNKSD
jgi:hypothetical protein